MSEELKSPGLRYAEKYLGSMSIEDLERNHVSEDNYQDEIFLIARFYDETVKVLEGISALPKDVEVHFSMNTDYRINATIDHIDSGTLIRLQESLEWSIHQWSIISTGENRLRISIWI